MVRSFSAPYSRGIFDHYHYIPRLIEFAANYFDLASFPDGETKRALQRAWNKRAGKDSTRGNGAISSGPVAKKVKKNKAAVQDGRD